MTRFFDILFSLVALIILAPLFIVVSIILILSGEHEIFYLQNRIGSDNEIIKVFKFATMLKNSVNMKGGVLTQQNDPRILPFGSFLRRTKINELPQLFNIFLGTMSFVGPRPQAKAHYDLYTEDQKHYISRMRPGLTGIGSLAFRDEESILSRSQHSFDYTHDNIIAPYKGDLEKWFYHNRCIFLYFKIIILTVLGVISSEINILHRFEGIPDVPKELEGLIS